MVNKTLGFVCPILSMIPFVPKSGEQEVQIAPIDTDAKRLINASILLGKIAATLSPGLIPSPLNPSEALATMAFSSPIKNSCLFPDSSVSTTAKKSSVPLNKFSARFNLASGKNCAPVINASGFDIKFIGPGSPITSVKSHIAFQKDPLFFTDQACNSS